MKKVLYISNIESPYRVRFFNELSQYCDLTVLFEREKSSNRNAEWSKSESNKAHIKFLHGINIGGENAFSLGILKEIFSGYDEIIVGCFNSPVQMMAILVMRLFRIPYMVNVDGETFLRGNSLKTKLKKFFLKGAKKYLVAGEKSAESIRTALGDKDIVPYYFSSLSDEEVRANAVSSSNQVRNKTILVVAQYLHCKGNDVALDAARMDTTLRYKFVGMGAKTEQFLHDYQGRIPDNVEIIPFLQKQELEEEYKRCAMLVLPSRQECWGLVINEAASFGMPIVSTWGSGAAVEFLVDEYPQYLAEPGDAEDLLECIHVMQNSEVISEYSMFLQNKSGEYCIERSVQKHIEALA
ncbi:MAG: glycosyltransferase family 4 protein [Oscillospiraceae bacterium]|nr:glycosyltransferase family 4 protein [Oscillospiraceae bacterium]